MQYLTMFRKMWISCESSGEKQEPLHSFRRKSMLRFTNLPSSPARYGTYVLTRTTNLYLPKSDPATQKIPIDAHLWLVCVTGVNHRIVALRCTQHYWLLVSLLWYVGAQSLKLARQIVRSANWAPGVSRLCANPSPSFYNVPPHRHWWVWIR